MPIIKTAPASNFSQIANELLVSAMPAKPQKVLLYLLSRPATWNINFADIKRRLGLSAYSTRSAMRWLMAHGYLVYQRLKSGRTIWRCYENPTTPPASPAIPPQVEIPQVENRPVLLTLETEEIQKQQPAAPTPPTVEPEEPEEVVVVSCSDSELQYPAQLTQIQRKAAKAVIKKVKQPELQQEVLFALAYAITNGSVKSPVAYLNGLVSRANRGTFEPVTNNAGSTQETAADRAERTKRQLEAARSVRIDNNSFFEDLQKRFGAKAAKAIGGAHG